MQAVRWTRYLWGEYKRAQRVRREARMPSRSAEIRALRGKGFDVQFVQDNHYRIDGTLDLFPLHRTYHFLPRDERGDYTEPMDIAVRLLRTPYVEA